MHRRTFLALGTLPAGCAMAQTTARSGDSNPAVSPFADPDFGFTAQIALGASYYRGGNPGKTLAILSRLKPGDFESAYGAFHAAGVEAQALAREAEGKRLAVSAREAWLWAGNYFSAALRFVDGTSDPDCAPGCWRDYATSWTGAARCFEPPVGRLEIPYGESALTAWFLRVDASGRRRPLVILNNGADGVESSMYRAGGAGALARGYNCLILNGPGQADSLWERKLHFRPDWEKVITPVVDAMLHHKEVDPKRIALIGVSMGGFWVPRALAFEHRIAAGVADPGVFDVSAPFFRTLPPFLNDMLRDGRKDQFDQVMKMGVAQDVRARMMSRMRMRPFGMSSYYDTWRASKEYHLRDVAGDIRCPMLVTDPEAEQFFPGQAQQLYDALRCPKTLIRFTRVQGAEQHCEVAAPGLRDYYVYNWLAEVLA